MNISEYMQYAAKILKDSDVETPAQEAGVMLCHVLKCGRAYLFSHGDRELSRAEQELLDRMTEQRAAGIPLQYILGETEFMSLTFKVSPAVLIPRQDTELLVEKCIELVNDIKLSGDKLLIGERTHSEEAVTKKAAAEAADTVEKGFTSQRVLAGQRTLQKQSLIKVLDVCTGSGCIAVSIAHYCPESVITACDISQDALNIARANSELNGTRSRVEFRHGDLFAALDTEQRFDIIASNPPYIETATIAELQGEVKDHEPRLALDGGDDGLEFYRKIVSQAPDYLNEHGWLVLEIGYNQGNEVSKLMERSFCDIKILRDFGGNDRVVAGQLV